MNKIIIAILVISALAISACVPPSDLLKVDPDKAPAGVDIIGETKNTDVIEAVVDKVESVEEVINAPVDSEVVELLAKADQKVKSLRYMYKGPETKDFFYDFFIVSNRIKYTLDPPYKVIDADDDAYDTIYLNTESKTALAYCDGRKCSSKGKKAVLDYDGNYILTPFDWIKEIKSAEKTGEQLISNRNTWILSGNNITMWVDTFFGIPLQVEFDENQYYFQKVGFNNVKEEEVSPKG